MDENLKSKSVLVADHGLFACFAARLAEDFGEVKYFTPWANAYPRAAGAHIGMGLEGVERVLTFWDHVPDADLVVFPDLYFADWQKVVAERFGKPVWGHRQAEALELDRRGTRSLQRRLGVAAPRTRVLIGVDALEDYLERTADKWVKISAFRGDGETWHHETWHTTSVYLHAFRNRVGALADRYEFLVEDAINDAVEVGYDGWTVGGRFPEACFWGIEVKDLAYVGQFSPYGELPAPIREINAAMSPVLADAGGSGFCSFEFRYDGKTAFMIDPCLRCGSPPTEGTIEAYANLAEIVWEGAHGRLARARPAGTFLAMAMMHSSFALTNWVPIDVPAEIARWVKLRNPIVLDGKLYHTPVGGEMPEIGAVVAVADTLAEAIRLVRERAEQVKGYQVEVHAEALDTAEEQIASAEKLGLKW